MNPASKYAVAVLSLTLASACVSIDKGENGKKSDKKEKVTTQSVARSVAPIFSVMDNGGAALTLKNGKASDEASAYSYCLDEEFSEDGFSLSSEIPDGHYGLEGKGVEIKDSATCGETGFLHWTLDDVAGQDCAGDEMKISGDGVVGFASTETGELAVVVLGDFDVEGLDVTCNIVITGTTFQAECETDGELLETDSCGEPSDPKEEEDACEIAPCSMDANDDGVANDPDHFSCQMIADDSSDDELETDNVACVEGCCVVTE